VALPVLVQQGPVEPDLTKTVVINRTASIVDEDGRKALRLDERPGDGVAWLENLQFTNGVIEIELKGRDVLQRSFLGVAFRGLGDKTYDAVYFRPFNFRADDPERRSHAVQYISHPTYTWNKLRAEKPGLYEKPITPPPDPNGWFRARIVIEKPKVSVFVNGAVQPSLADSRNECVFASECGCDNWSNFRFGALC